MIKLPPRPQALSDLQATCLGRRHCRASASAASSADFRDRKPHDVRVLVLGATGYIGKFVVKELLRRGYDVTAFARPKSGIKGRSSKEDVQKVSCKTAVSQSVG